MDRVQIRTLAVNIYSELNKTCTDDEMRSIAAMLMRMAMPEELQRGGRIAKGGR